MSRIFKTLKGTDLPIMLLRGKEYLEVKYRIVWFREDHPEWRIETELPVMKDDCTVARATIRNESGYIMATAHKSETKGGFADHMEKAETGAIGRALAMVGYGTQFCADELDEGDRVVDAPVDPKRGAETIQDLVDKAPQATTSMAAPKCSLCGKQMKLSKAGLHFFCPDFNKKDKGEHPTVKA